LRNIYSLYFKASAKTKKIITMYKIINEHCNNITIILPLKLMHGVIQDIKVDPVSFARPLNIKIDQLE